MHLIEWEMHLINLDIVLQAGTSFGGAFAPPDFEK